MFVDGYFRVGRLAGVDLRLHWSVPLGAAIFGGLRLEPISWLAFCTVLVVHELGHALLVSVLGLELTGLDVTGFGGHCRFRGSADALDQAIVAWGGVLAQALLLLGTLLGVALFGHATTHGGALVEHAFVEVNLWVVAINLLPFAPLDGARAWRLFPELAERRLTLRRLLLYPLWRWAQRRREQRGAAPAALSSSNPNAARSAPKRRARPVPAVSDRSDASGVDADEDLGEKPSAQAQRELAALLERIGDEAGRAKKRR